MFLKGYDGVLSYPIDNVHNLSKSRLVNPTKGDHHGIGIPKGFDLNESTREVAMVRFHVERDMFPFEFMEKYYPFTGEFPKLITQPLMNEGLKFKYPQGLADVVHMDNPMDAPLACLKWLLDEGANVKSWTDHHINFIESVPDMNYSIASYQKKAIRKVFQVKYFYGLDRPEEVMFDECMTAYNEGCPNHPSFPAGHGALVGAGVKAIIDNFDLTKNQLKVLLDTAYIWAMSRTLAGVHHAHDNVAGLIVGGLGEYFNPNVLSIYKR